MLISSIYSQASLKKGGGRKVKKRGKSGGVALIACPVCTNRLESKYGSYGKFWVCTQCSWRASDKKYKSLVSLREKALEANRVRSK